VHKNATNIIMISVSELESCVKNYHGKTKKQCSNIEFTPHENNNQATHENNHRADMIIHVCIS
jgi:hypothetical protein